MNEGNTRDAARCVPPFLFFFPLASVARDMLFFSSPRYRGETGSRPL